MKDKFLSRAGVAGKWLGITLISFIILFLLGSFIGYTIVGQGNPLNLFRADFWQTLFSFF